ncbi:hypothetical protein VQL36_14670 [Chengkuizengella sp. SCS-71B]|uniref:hypothetical protein n=1 Tax=Chengkuizengella sp. SCS-71B TaxID=3115290 RepID=UPI0032C22321
MAMSLSKRLNMPQKEVAVRLNMSRSAVAMIDTEKRKLPEDREPIVARMSFKMAIEIANERTGGYISNLFDTYGEDVDLHSSALKERLLIEMKELYTKLEALTLSRMNPLKKKELVTDLLMEIEDVEEVIHVMKGSYAEEFGIDLVEVSKRRKELIRNGER